MTNKMIVQVELHAESLYCNALEIRHHVLVCDHQQR